jgi:hypothetical protein
MGDRVTVDAGCQQLPSRNDPMLLVREFGDQAVRVFSSTAYDRLN